MIDLHRFNLAGPPYHGKFPASHPAPKFHQDSLGKQPKRISGGRPGHKHFKAELLIQKNVFNCALPPRGVATSSCLGVRPKAPDINAVTDSFDTLYLPPTFEEKYKQTTLLAELGASFDGIKFLALRGDTIVPSLATVKAAIPANLTVEPGLTYLALATQAYMALFSGAITALFPALPNSLVGPVNEFKHQATLDYFVNGVPLGNGNSLYSTAAVTLVNGPLLLTLPPYSGGYWLISLYDVYGEVYQSLSSRQGTAGGKWLLAPNDWQEAVPADVTVIRVPTLESIILGRTAVNGTGAGPWTLTWKLEQWERRPTDILYLRFGLGYGYPNTDYMAFMVNPPDPLAFWKVAGEVFRRNGGPSIPRPLVGQLDKLGIYKDYGFIAYGLNENVTDALKVAPRLANRIMVAKYTFLGLPETNYWKVPQFNGAWGHDYVLGGAMMRGFFISNILQDAAYYYLYLDNTATPMEGTFVYEVVFPSAPPATSGAFWSLQAQHLDEWLLIWGPYPGKPALSSSSPGLYVRPDGSIPIRTQNTPPPANSTAQSRGWNWVPGYPGRISLTLRVYAGDESVLSNTYVPPPVYKVGVDPGLSPTAQSPSSPPPPPPLPSPRSQPPSTTTRRPPPRV